MVMLMCSFVVMSWCRKRVLDIMNPLSMSPLHCTSRSMSATSTRLTRCIAKVPGKLARIPKARIWLCRNTRSSAIEWCAESKETCTPRLTSLETALTRRRSIAKSENSRKPFLTPLTPPKNRLQAQKAIRALRPVRSDSWMRWGHWVKMCLSTRRVSSTLERWSLTTRSSRSMRNLSKS